MEQVRILLAIVLSFLVFFLWNLFFVEKPTVKEQPAEKGTQAEVPAAQPPVVAKKEAVQAFDSQKKTDADAGTQTQIAQARILQINTPMYSVRISERGAIFKSFRLNHYRETSDPESDALEMISQEMNPGSVGLGFGGQGVTGWQEAVFEANVDTDVVDVSGQPRDISFAWVSPEGVVVEKRFSFVPDSYLIEMTVSIRNGSAADLGDFFYLYLTKFLPESKQRFGFEGPSALVDGGLQQVEMDDIKEKDLVTGTIGWIAVQDRYFMSNIIPENPAETGMRIRIHENTLIESRFIQPMGTIASGSQKAFRYRLFFGPKSLEILKSYGADLDRAIDFGWFDFIAKPCVWIMNFFYRFIPNYGVAIIILTLLIKILLWPLGNKSYKSMAEMKKIQPLVTELREKYKDDKKKMNEEMMKLYRVYKVNPVGGCLPMVLQIPVFFALYRMLYETIELRHAPFVGWITDLSAPDRLFRFNFSIPMMEPPYGIPVLTIIMGGTMLLQQKMSPPPGDPTQAKMMMLMPIVFTVIFINFSSGLVLYWLISNLISIAQQYYVQKKQA